MSQDKAKKAAKPWFQYAIDDLQLARFILASSPKPYYAQIAFFCQQSIEKSIKGFLVYHKKRFTKIHDLVKLSKLALEIDASLSDLLRDAAKTTPFAVAYRYPDAEVEPVTRPDVDEALVLAQNVFREITSRIPLGAQWDV